MKHGSLFSGIGGFDLAAEWMGWENVFHCECNEFGQRILKHYWPKAISYDDITKTDFTIHNGTIDVITGGFPCQPYSHAGKRLGKEDDRHLWPEMLRAIREIAPRYVVGENVSGLLSWNGGLVFNEVQADLEAEGYEVQPILLPACGVNAPHRRDRIFIVAYRNAPNPNGSGKRTSADPNGSTEGPPRKSGSPESERSKNNDEQGKRRSEAEQHIGSHGLSRTSANTDSERLQREGGPAELGRVRLGCNNAQANQPNWKNFPTQPPICGGNDGLSDRLDGITFPKWRNESIKGYGNAIVPSLVVEIFKAIQTADRQARGEKTINTADMNEPELKTGT